MMEVNVPVASIHSDLFRTPNAFLLSSKFHVRLFRRNDASITFKFPCFSAELKSDSVEALVTAHSDVQDCEIMDHMAESIHGKEWHIDFKLYYLLHFKNENRSVVFDQASIYADVTLRNVVKSTHRYDVSVHLKNLSVSRTPHLKDITSFWLSRPGDKVPSSFDGSPLFSTISVHSNTSSCGVVDITRFSVQSSLTLWQDDPDKFNGRHKHKNMRTDAVDSFIGMLDLNYGAGLIVPAHRSIDRPSKDTLHASCTRARWSFQPNMSQRVPETANQNYSIMLHENNMDISLLPSSTAAALDAVSFNSVVLGTRSSYIATKLRWLNQHPKDDKTSPEMVLVDYPNVGKAELIMLKQYVEVGEVPFQSSGTNLSNVHMWSSAVALGEMAHWLLFPELEEICKWIMRNSLDAQQVLTALTATKCCCPGPVVQYLTELILGYMRGLEDIAENEALFRIMTKEDMWFYAHNCWPKSGKFDNYAGNFINHQWFSMQHFTHLSCRYNDEQETM